MAPILMDADAERKRRVVQVCLGYHPETGGSALAVKHFADVFGGMIINFSDRPAPDSANVHTVQVSHTVAGTKFSWATGSALTRGQAILKDAELIICHTLLRYHVQWAARIARRHGIPLWIVPHGSLDPWVFTYRKRQKEVWMRLFGNSILASASAVICASDGEQRKVRVRGVRMDTRVVLWPVDDPDLMSNSAAREATRAKMGISEADRMLLFIGRLHGMKQPLETIRAVALSQAENVHLVMVGGDDTVTAEECRQFASSQCLPRVHIVGPIFDERKWNYFSAADGYISLSLRENFGFTAAEALIARKPVILSPGNDLARDLARVDCGWMLEHSGAEAGAEAIRDFAHQSEDSLCGMGRRGRAWALANLSREKFQSSLEELFNDTVPQHSNS